jgi:hypothetical protein
MKITKGTETKCAITESIKNSFKRRSSNHSDDNVTNQTESSTSSAEEQMESSHLTSAEEDCVEGLKDFCRTSGIAFSDELIFRYACFDSFNFEHAKEAIEENRENGFLKLKMKSSLKGQFNTKALFPLPGLKTRKCDSEVLYIRPSRYFPEEVDATTVIESLCYVLNDMSDTEEKCRNGVAFISNMKGFEIENFNVDHWFQFMMTLQGNLVPTKVNLLLIVNAPSWFQQDVWKKMKPALSASFSKNVHMIKSDKLSDYLMDDYREFLPTELSHGYLDINELVEDYIDLKAHQDE